MAATIRPNRLEVNDRFPMLGFTIQTDGTPQRAEVTLASDLVLFSPEHQARRTPANFYSSRAEGPLAVPRGEAVYLVPPEVLARFIGSERLYVALATAPERNGTGYRVEVFPTEGSPYVGLSSLTGRSLRRVRLLPTRQERAAGYGSRGGPSLEWAGDAARPGQQPAARTGPGQAPAPASAPSSGGSAEHTYDDGFGPMTEPDPQFQPQPPQPPQSPQPPQPQRPVPGVQALDLSGLRVESGRMPVQAPGVTALGSVETTLVQAALAALAGPMAPLITALPLAARAAKVSIGIGPAVGAGLGGGLGLGVGVVFAPDGAIGVYGAAEFQVGFLASISATAQFTVVRGGLASFNGWGLAASISGGEGIVGGASALFDLNGNFQGVSLQLGVGAGLTPVDFYIAVQRQVAAQVAQSLGLPMTGAYGRGGTAFGAAEDEDARHDIGGPIPDQSPAAQSQAYGRAFSEDPEYPQASRFVAAAAGNFRSHPGPRRIERVVIHITDGGPHVSGTIAWFQNPEARVSAHYVVGQDGEVVQMVRHNDVAWHAGGANSTGIGIEHCANTRGLMPSDAQYCASAALVSWLCDTYGIPKDRDHIQGHAEADPRTTHRACPNAVWDWDHYIDLIQNAYCRPRAGVAAGQAVRALSGEIALDPGNGGRSIGLDALEVGDIILTTTAAAVSGLIRFGTGSAVSHAMLYVDQGGQVIDSTADGVRLRPLAGALDDATLAVAFRYPGLSAAQRQIIADKAAEFLGLSYNYWGIVRQAAFQVDSGVCGLLPAAAAESCRRFVGRVDLGTGGGNEFFCSELVVAAYQQAGVPLTSTPPNWSSPDDLAELSTRHGVLAYVGHLKAPPYQPRPSLWEAVGLGLAAGTRPPVGPERGRYPTRTLGDQSFSLNWDDVQLVPQRHDLSCWAAAASMVIGWRDQVSIDEGTLATIAGRVPDQGLEPGDRYVRAFADALGLVPEPPQSYTVEGFRRLLESNGPLWVGKQMGGGIPDAGHVVVVVGLYSDGTETYVRIADPWDRVVGSPGAPGNYVQGSHASGSRYIMTYAGFVAEYEWLQVLDNAAAGAGHGRVNPLQILHSGGTQGRLPSYGAPPPGYAQGLAAGPRVRPVAVPAWPARARGLGGPTRRIDGGGGGVTYSLDQYDGIKAPAGMAVTGPVVPAPGPALDLADWPFIEGPTGRTYGAVRIDWRHQGGSVGSVALSVPDARASDGYGLAISGTITDGPDTAAVAALTITLRYEFSHGGVPVQVALVEVRLYGDGRFERENRWETQPQARAA